jgi:hypothetical protein
MNRRYTGWLVQPDSTKANEKKTFTGTVRDRCFLGDGLCLYLFGGTVRDAICEAIDEYYG